MDENEELLPSQSSNPSLNSIESLMKAEVENDDEKIDDAFQCCVCLDLLYKPIVLACGHISCFWCICYAMSHRRASLFFANCPICRCRYRHFPSICQLLHFVLLKMYPQAYKRRETQILEEERNAQCFSPQIDKNLADASKDLTILTCASASSSTAMSHGKSILLVSDVTSVNSKEKSSSNVEVATTLSVEDGISQENSLKDRDHEAVSINDFLCIACKQILYCPTVLNCGHVYCESCLSVVVGDLTCLLCESLHPEGLPKVCLEFDHFLEERFPEEYASRKKAVQLLECQTGRLSSGVTQSDKQLAMSPPCLLTVPSVHFRFGCDYCGLNPIVGRRYNCKDCTESIGFDLCGDCYDSHSMRPGRFNQQHTLEHTFQLMRSTLDAEATPDEFTDESETEEAETEGTEEPYFTT